ncbi:MAG: hypothetical protein GY926_14045 [bacterium]|nr:hypothetical protein [bacterium]
MSVLRRMFSTRGSKIHLLAFSVLSLVFAALDLAQGRDSNINFLTLDWAHVLIVLWTPIVTIHGLVNLWVKSTVTWS